MTQIADRIITFAVVSINFLFVHGLFIVTKSSSRSEIHALRKIANPALSDIARRHCISRASIILGDINKYYPDSDALKQVFECLRRTNLDQRQARLSSEVPDAMTEIWKHTVETFDTIHDIVSKILANKEQTTPNFWTVGQGKIDGSSAAL